MCDCNCVGDKNNGLQWFVEQISSETGGGCKLFDILYFFSHLHGKKEFPGGSSFVAIIPV